ncbi:MULTISPECIES: hypothetical protein [unclassified Diaminobutyricimonas]|uniref:hypothetical protein n=1 Tax=unclassified Diaminobutyricimonas TaxID=2643261 RepID=UPI0012F4EFC3|nr:MULTISPECIES: hypothetical protein [unclassified Diaminobutyricimonas]
MQGGQSDGIEIFDVDDDGSDEPEPRRSLRTAATTVIVIAVTLAALGSFGYQSVIAPVLERGNCFVLSPDHCTSLSVTRIEEAANVTILDGVTVVQSGSLRSLKSVTVTAVLEVSDIDAFALGDGYVRATGEAVSSVPMLQRQIERAIASVEDVWTFAQRSGRATVYFATDDDGVRLVIIRAVLDSSN